MKLMKLLVLPFLLMLTNLAWADELGCSEESVRFKFELPAAGSYPQNIMKIPTADEKRLTFYLSEDLSTPAGPVLQATQKGEVFEVFVDNQPVTPINFTFEQLEQLQLTQHGSVYTKMFLYDDGGLCVGT